MELGDKRGSIFLNIVAIIGAILIFVGVAWLIAKNWHQIPNAIKILILIFSVLASFTSGVLLKKYEHEGVGRSLIALGALLYILSLFLISQIYHLAISIQHYAWLLFFAWTIIFVTAYFLNSKENLIISMLAFFPWIVLQYLSSISEIIFGSSGGVIFNFILIFLGIGALFYGLSVFHNSIKHKFTNVYRFWTVFYFLLIFYVLSFQLILPIISEYSFEGEAFSIFFIIFIILCFFGFIFGALFAVSKNSVSIKRILGFLGILAILFILIFSTKAGAGLIGYCQIKSCYDFKTPSECSSPPDSSFVCMWRENSCSFMRCYYLKTESECNSAPYKLNCDWDSERNHCRSVDCYDFRTESECNNVSDKFNCNWNNLSNYCKIRTCYDFRTESECNSASNELDCIWKEGSCIVQETSFNSYKKCLDLDKNACVDESACVWRPYHFGHSIEKLPTIFWILWILNNFVFIGFIILVIWYGQNVGSTKIINLGLIAFILEIITRYIGFWFDFSGYFAFSILAILGGLMLILGAWLIPKWRKKILSKTNNQIQQQSQRQKRIK